MSIPFPHSDLPPDIVASPKDSLFSVERTAHPPYFVEAFPTHIRYKENRRRAVNAREMIIPSEIIAPKTIALSRAALQRWEPPHEAEPLEDADRDRILERIQEAAQISITCWDIHVR